MTSDKVRALRMMPIASPVKRPPRVSFEFFPPKTRKMETQLWDSIRRLEPLRPNFVSVTYGAGGSTRTRTHNTVKRIVEETTLTPAAHLTCVGATREEVDEVIRDYWAAGIRHIVALRGDPPAGEGAFAPHPGGYESSVELVRGIKRIADFEVSVGAYPEPHPDSHKPGQDVEHLKRKVDAGADRAITQFFWECEHFLRFRDEVAKAGIEVPLVPGIIPVGNFVQISGFARNIGAIVPGWLEKLYEGLDEDEETRALVGAVVAIEQSRLLQSEGVADFHFYTLNRADLTFAICHALGIRAKPQDGGAMREPAAPKAAKG